VVAFYERQKWLTISSKLVALLQLRSCCWRGAENDLIIAVTKITAVRTVCTHITVTETTWDDLRFFAVSPCHWIIWWRSFTRKRLC